MEVAAFPYDLYNRCFFQYTDVIVRYRDAIVLYMNVPVTYINIIVLYIYDIVYMDFIVLCIKIAVLAYDLLGLRVEYGAMWPQTHPPTLFFFGPFTTANWRTRGAHHLNVCHAITRGVNGSDSAAVRH